MIMPSAQASFNRSVLKTPLSHPLTSYCLLAALQGRQEISFEVTAQAPIAFLQSLCAKNFQPYNRS
jgi:hypothetical protein